MSGSKKIILITTVLLIIVIGVFTTILDFSRFSGSYDLYHAYPVEFIKRINVLLSFLLIWLAGKDSLSKRDNIYMKAVFIAICCGELCFLFAKPAWAIGFFTGCQCLLISRHCLGLKCKIKKASSIQKLILALLFFVFILLFLSTIIFLYPMIIINSLVIIGGFYGIVLSISLWAGLANYILGLYPCKNSKMIAIGMLCFYFCDISVGLDGLLLSGTAWLLAISFTWVFYTPAITLLALSCYKYKTNSVSAFNLRPR